MKGINPSCQFQNVPKVDPSRKTSLAAGLLYILTFVSIPTIAIYSQVKSANYILGAGPDTATIIGGILEVIVALAGIGTAVILFPILKKQHEGLALGLVASRVLEASSIFLGVAFILSIVTLRQTGAGADALVSSNVLVTLYDRIFLLSQSLLPAVNDLLTRFPALQVPPGASSPFADRYHWRSHTHRWLATRNIRSHRAECPSCSVVRNSSSAI